MVGNYSNVIVDIKTTNFLNVFEKVLVNEKTNLFTYTIIFSGINLLWIWEPVKTIVLVRAKELKCSYVYLLMEDGTQKCFEFESFKETIGNFKIKDEEPTSPKSKALRCFFKKFTKLVGISLKRRF